MKNGDANADQVGSWFPSTDAEDPPQSLRGLFAKARAQLGFVPNVFRAYAFRPERLSLWFSHFRALHEPSEGLTAADREMIGVVVSAANRCLYCLVAHSASLREALQDPVEGEWIAFDWRRANLDPRRFAICAYAEKLTLDPRETGAADLQSLLDAGLSSVDAWDVIELTAMYNFTNRMAAGTGMLPNQGYSGMGRPAPGVSVAGQGDVDRIR